MHRSLWSFVSIWIALVALRRLQWVTGVLRQPRLVAQFALSAFLLSANWLLYVWSVNHGHVVEASLGYFVTPLVNVMLGTWVLKERPRRLQWLAVGVAACGVLWLTLTLGRPPWIALGLAGSFGSYGLLRKTAPLGALEGLAMETAVMAPVALVAITPEGPAAVATPQWLSRLAILADFGVAVITGYFSDLFGKGQAGWEALDNQDFRAWLDANGANATTIASGPVNAFYDLTFAAVQGRDIGLGSGSLAAGVSLLAQMEMVLGYRDAPLFKMAAGMGDTVFTPFYDVLTARNVAINFYSRVTQVTPGNDGGLAQIDILTQAATIGGAAYRPFVRVGDLDCWPNAPDWSQLVDGAQMAAAGVDFESSTCEISVGPAKPLIAGTDFDIAILAMPPQVLGGVAQPLATANPTWNAALGASRSVATQSLQLWMKPDLAKLGWTYGSTVLTAFEEPLDSWGDMSQVIPRETWPAAETPGSIAYFCGCMAIPLGLPVGKTLMNAEAVTYATGWMSANLATLWPDVGSDAVAQSSVQSRYDVSNFDLSDTYVQTPAGSNVASRLDPGATAGYSNLYVVGDWTRTRFSGGCFESAVESAMLASRAISGFPQAIKTS